MGFFSFGKKDKNVCCGTTQKEQAPTSCCTPPAPETPKASCSCGGDCSGETATPEKAKIIVLGACCKKSADTFENVKQALNEMGIAEEVMNIGDTVEIAKYGVMQTPALVINGKVVSHGKYLSTADVKKLLEHAGIK